MSKENPYNCGILYKRSGDNNLPLLSNVVRLAADKTIASTIDKAREEVQGTSFIWYTLIFITSVILGLFIEQVAIIYGLSVFSFLLGILLIVCEGLSLINRRYRVWSKILILLALGLFYPTFHSLIIIEPRPVETIPYSMTASVEGQVRKLALYKQGVRMELTLTKDIPYLSAENVVRVSTRQVLDGLKVGDIVKGEARLMPLSRAFIPQHFSYREYFARKGIGAVGYFIRDPQIIEHKTGTSDFMLSNLRYEIAQKIAHYLSADKDVAAIAIALITGGRDGISKEVRESIRLSGLSHLLAISGLHIGLVAMFVMMVGKFLWSCSMRLSSHYDSRIPIGILACLFALMYTILAGGLLPTQRAFVMVALAFFAIIIGRVPISRNLLAFAAIVVVVIDPQSLLTPSFQMSFMATLAIISFYQDIYLDKDFYLRREALIREGWEESRVIKILGLSRNSSRVHSFTMGILITSILATFATLPFVIYHFSFFSLYGVIANFAGIVLVSLWILPISLLIIIPTYLCDSYDNFFSSLLGFLWHLIGYGIEGLVRVAELFSGEDQTLIWEGNISHGSILLFVIGLLIILILRTSLRYLGGVVIIVGLVLEVFFPQQPPLLLVSPEKLSIGLVDKERSHLYTTDIKNSFVNDYWRRYFGLEKVLKWDIGKGVEKDIEYGGEKLRISCDGNSCIFSDKKGIEYVRVILRGDIGVSNGIEISPNWEREINECKDYKGAGINLIDIARVKCLGSHVLYIRNGKVWVESDTMLWS